MSNSFVKVDMEKLNRLIVQLDKKAFVDIGIIENVQYPDSGKSIAEVGATHEFGTDKAGRGEDVTVEERSFIRMPLEEKAEEIEKDAEKNLEENLANGDVDKILNQIGASGEGKIQEAFETGRFGKWPDIKESTKKRKGSSKILIDESYLRKAISYKTSKGGK